MEERLQKYLANQGIASRRKCEEYILDGRVKVNGKVVDTLGAKIDPEKDVIEFDGKKIEGVEKKVYIILDKPIGYVTTSKDQFGRPTVLDLIHEKEKVLPVGRLDMYTSGALLLSNDGEFINYITHPKNEIEKTYTVTIKGIVTDEDVENLKKGVAIDDYVSGEAKVKILHIDNEKKISRLAITIHEGKNREVRKMIEAIGKKVLALHRRKIGNLDIKNMKIGTYRFLSRKEVEDFYNHKNNLKKK
jgi:23S rRNA pseudouridine2605 synthase